MQPLVPLLVLLQIISTLISAMRKSDDCSRPAPQQLALSCFSLQPLAWFSGTAMRRQLFKAPSGVSGEILALPQPFSVQCQL